MAEVFPTSLKHRTTPNLRLGIKSSCGDLKSIIAALYIIFKSSKTPESIVYSKEKVLENGITGIDFQVVESLPSTGTTGTIYLVAKSTSGTNNIYTEWIYVNSKWEQLGDTQVDLSGYLQTSSIITNTEIDTLTSN